MAHPAHLNNFPAHTGLNMNTQYQPNHNRNHNAYATTNTAASLSAQASLQTSLNALNSKIVQAQSLALLNNITVDEVLSRMGGLNEMELGLLRLCAAREQEARLQASLMSQQQQQMAILQQQQQQQKQQATTRNPSNRLSFPGMPSNRQPATNASWEESFGNLSLGGPDVVRTPTPKSANSTSASAQTQVTPPKVDKRTSPTSATSTAGLAAGKHEQAATWRRGSPSASQQTSISPAATPVRGISANAGAEPANKAFNFNGVFGNKVVGLPRQASQTSSVESSTTTNAKADGEGRKERVRTGRSGSASSSEGFESGSGSGSVLSDQPQQYQQERQDRLERSFVGRARESTFAGSTSSSSFESVGTPPPVLITPPCEPLENQYSGKQGSGTPNNGGYFGIKRVISGEQGNGNVNVNGNGKYGPGVIGQGFGSPSTVLFPGGVGSTAYGVVIRQPHGPPGGADELGNKNFASRLRQKAVNDLGLLGRRRANSPNPHAVAA